MICLFLSPSFVLDFFFNPVYGLRMMPENICVDPVSPQCLSMPVYVCVFPYHQLTKPKELTLESCNLVRRNQYQIMVMTGPKVVGVFVSCLLGHLF